MDKVQKIREEVVRLKSQLLRGACSSQIAIETRCKEEAYDEVLTLLDSMQEEHDRMVDQCIYGKEPELVDVDDLPVVVDAPSEDYVKGFAVGRLYEQRQKSETSVWHDASEEPKEKDKPIVIQLHNGELWSPYIVEELSQGWEVFKENTDIKKWAYIEDLEKL